jgi:vancomycin resistance protein YoaR
MSILRLRTKRGFVLTPPIKRILSVLLSATIVVVVGLAIFLVGTRIFYANKAFPGVEAAGIQLSGMTEDEIEILLHQSLTYPQTGLIAFHDGEDVTLSRPEDLGVSIDSSSMARNALRVGREGHFLRGFSDQLRAWFRGATIPPIVIFDQREAKQFLSQLAMDIDLPQIEAQITITGVEVETSPGQVGRRLDLDAILLALLDPISRMHDAQVMLDIEEIPPRVLDASEQALIAKSILRQPLVLTAEEGKSWIVESQALAGMLQFYLVQSNQTWSYQVRLDPNQLVEILIPLSVELNRLAENARFIFNDETKELDVLSSEIVGRSLNIPDTIDSIQNKLLSDNHEVALLFDNHEPAVKADATAEDLGISEPVSVVSTYFYDSGSARVQNISTAAATFHGLLVPPGETLSMAEVMGDVSLDNGYAEALIIFGDRTIKGVGGGVCQVSTTLFRAAFFGGYPIVERHPHAYRVGYYEQGPSSPGPGLDATVFVPIVDFKFTNDRDDWLLLETYVYGNQLLWKFYSTSDGREVEWTKEETNEVDAPEPLYKENPDLPKDEIRQVDWEADGLDVYIERIVVRDGETLFEDDFETHYLPWRAIFEYGPGTKLPKDAKTE